jgi:hypothetical protein
MSRLPSIFTALSQFAALFLLLSSTTVDGQNMEHATSEQATSEQADRAILESVFSSMGDYQANSTSELMIRIGDFFKGSPYAEHTLEQEPENLVVNLREFDCTTFAESCLAISRTLQSGKLSFEQFTSELRGIRYRIGKVDGYASRIHYFSDWIHFSNQKLLVRDVSREIGGTPLSKKINFMSTHPASYMQLASNPSLIEIIAAQEEEISAREQYYISLDSLPDLESGLRDGDIVGITTSIEGLDILHVGILVRKSNGIHLLHASSRHGKVILSEETLEVYLAENKSATGIMVARPL